MKRKFIVEGEAELERLLEGVQVVCDIPGREIGNYLVKPCGREYLPNRPVICCFSRYLICRAKYFPKEAKK